MVCCFLFAFIYFYFLIFDFGFLFPVSHTHQRQQRRWQAQTQQQQQQQQHSDCTWFRNCGVVYNWLKIKNIVLNNFIKALNNTPKYDRGSLILGHCYHTTHIIIWIIILHKKNFPKILKIRGRGGKKGGSLGVKSTTFLNIS